MPSASKTRLVVPRERRNSIRRAAILRFLPFDRIIPPACLGKSG